MNQSQPASEFPVHPAPEAARGEHTTTPQSTEEKLDLALDIISRTASERTQQSLANQIDCLDRRSQRMFDGSLSRLEAAGERIDELADAILVNQLVSAEGSEANHRLNEVLTSLQGLKSQDLSDQVEQIVASQQRTEESLQGLQQLLADVLLNSGSPAADRSEDTLAATCIVDSSAAEPSDTEDLLESIRSQFGVSANETDVGESDDEEVVLVGVEDDLNDTNSDLQGEVEKHDTVAGQLAHSMAFEIDSASPSIPLAELVAPQMIEDPAEMSRESLTAAVHERDEFITGLILHLRDSERLNVDKLVSSMSSPEDFGEATDRAESMPPAIRESLDRLNDMLRLAEIETSMERARLSRQRQNLLYVRQQLQKRATQLSCTVSDDDQLIPSDSVHGGSGRRRWLSKLGIGKDG